MTADEFRELLQRLANASEYLAKGPSDQERFVSVNGKDWRRHAGNYP